MKYNRKRVFALSAATVLVVVAAVFIIKHFFFQETLHQAARRVLQAMQNFDAGTLMSYVSDEEKELANLSEDKLQRFLDEFVKPRLEGFRPVAGIRTYKFAAVGELGLLQRYQHPDGRMTKLFSSVMITENGIKAVNLTHDLYNWVLFTEWPAEKPRVSGPETFQFSADTTIKYKEQLEKTGLSGVVATSGAVYTNEYKRKFYTWDELAEMYLDVKRKIEESRARSGQAAH